MYLGYMWIFHYFIWDLTICGFCRWVLEYIYTYTHTHIYKYIYIHTHTYIHICIHVHTHIYTYAYYIHIDIYISIYLYVVLYMHIWIHIYTHLYVVSFSFGAIMSDTRWDLGLFQKIKSPRKKKEVSGLSSEDFQHSQSPRNRDTGRRDWEEATREKGGK